MSNDNGVAAKFSTEFMEWVKYNDLDYENIYNADKRERLGARTAKNE